jgi:hypothetical protein
LKKQVQKTQASSAEERDDALQETQAIYLARFKDKKEQVKLAEALKTSREQRVRDQGKLITAYKEVKTKNPELAKKVLSGKMDLVDMKFEHERPKVPEMKKSKSLMAYEQSLKVRGMFDAVGNVQMEELEAGEKTLLFSYMRSWTKSHIVPFVEKLIDSLSSEDDKKRNFTFKFDGG